jgi:hypothetical protein
MVETKSLDQTIAQFFGKQALPEKPQEESNQPAQPQIVQPKESILQKIEQLKKQLLELEQEVRAM